MKYQLNESSQKRQKAILDALKTGVPLAGLLAVTALSGGGCSSSEPLTGDIAPVAAESSKAPAQQPNRPNEALSGRLAIDGDTFGNEINERTPETVMPTGALAAPEERPELPKQTTVYRVVKGDTMWKIAKTHNIKLDVLLTLNQMSREQAEKIVVGQEIIVPAEQNK